jgi:hypothetical protein
MQMARAGTTARDGYVDTFTFKARSFDEMVKQLLDLVDGLLNRSRSVLDESRK